MNKCAFGLSQAQASPSILWASGLKLVSEGRDLVQSQTLKPTGFNLTFSRAWNYVLYNGHNTITPGYLGILNIEVRSSVV